MGKLSQSYLKELAKNKYKSGGFSTEGYKRNSPDVNNPYNVIPSNRITMKDVDFPIRAISDTGDERIIYPGEEHLFQGNYVTEFPLKNMGNKRFGQVGLEKPSESFLKNWVEKRKIADDYIQQAYSMDQPELIKRAQAFPTVTTVPDIEGNPNITGRYERGTGNVLRTPNAPPHITTHEQSHYLFDFPNYMRTVHKDLVPREIKPAKELEGLYKEKYDYFSDPDEVHSRIMVLREKAGFQPDKEVTEKDLNKFLEGYKGDIDNINDIIYMSKDKNALLNMLNYMAVNENPTEYYGQKGFYKPDFRSKSQIAAQQGNTGESTKVAPKINPVDMRKAQEAAMQRAIANQPTFRQGRTLSANEQAENQARLAKLRDQQQEEENRRRLTFTGNAEARGAGTLMQPLLDVINPFSYYYSGKDALRGLGQAAEGVTNLDLGQIGSGLAGATFGALGAIPATSEFKPLFGAAGKTLAKPALKAASSLGKPGVSRNLADLQAAKKFAKQYGYELPKNLKRVAESDVLTDRTIRGLMNRHNTVVRGVSTNWNEVQKRVPKDVWNDIVKTFEKQGIDYINNPKAAAEYMATHIPFNTSYGRAGLKPGEYALYTSNSMPTAEGYTYGQGYAVKAKRPTDFSSANRQDWIAANDYPISYGFKNSPFGVGTVKSDYAKRIPTSLRDVAYAAGDPSIIQNAIKKSDEAYELATERNLKLREEYVNRIMDMRRNAVQNDPNYKGSYWDYKMPLKDRAKEAYYNTLMNLSHLSAEASVIPPVVGGLLDRRNMAALGKNLFSPIFGEIDPYAHYVIKGTPGEKVLDPIRSTQITPEMWSNKSRAHVGKYSRGLTRRELGGTIPAKTYQGGGTILAEPDYDIYKAPKQGNYLLPDINRPYYTDEQGENRSEYKIGFNINGKETLLPTVVGGRQLTPEEAISRYRQTGLHMGQYNTPEEAEYASRLRTAKYNMLQDPARFNASMFQMGGTMGIPGVNGQVVSSGPQPLTSVRKTRGPINKTKKGDVKTMSSKQVKQTLKYSKQKPNKI